MVKRIRDYGFRWTGFEPGHRNLITDVPGVRVGHSTIRDEIHHTGVTVILPCEGNIFAEKLTAACFVMNGFGKTVGLVQIDELGTLETPIALTNTLCVGKVSDALVSVVSELCENDHIRLRSVNPVVGECNDARLNRILDRVVGEEQVREAIACAGSEFQEGDVGAGTGTICHGLKGGIGSASRIISVGKEKYTIGVLVQSNHGVLNQLCIQGRAIGREIENKLHHAGERECDQGSIMMIVATDLPVTDRQLRRILKRCAVGLARCGSYIGHGSGDVMIGFTTARRIPILALPAVLDWKVVSEESLESAFRAVADATEEAVLNSLVSAHPVKAEDGRVIESLASYL